MHKEQQTSVNKTCDYIRLFKIMHTKYLLTCLIISMYHKMDVNFVIRGFRFTLIYIRVKMHCMLSNFSDQLILFLAVKFI